MFFVHRSCRDITGVARPIGAAISTNDKRDGSLQHEQPRVKLVRVRSTMHVWFDFALAKLIALAPKVGFKLGFIHAPFNLSQPVRPRTPADNEPTEPRSRATGLTGGRDRFAQAEPPPQLLAESGRQPLEYVGHKLSGLAAQALLQVGWPFERQPGIPSERTANYLGVSLIVAS
jgi:hypothetical protein